MKYLLAVFMALVFVAMAYADLSGVLAAQESEPSQVASQQAASEAEDDPLVADGITLTLYAVPNQPQVIQVDSAAVSPSSPCVTYTVGSSRTFFCGTFKLEIKLPKFDPDKITPESKAIPGSKIQS